MEGLIYSTADRFPEDTLVDVSNHCRNPDGSDGGAWCYTVDPDTRWQYCNVDPCPEGTDTRLFYSKKVPAQHRILLLQGPVLSQHLFTIEMHSGPKHKMALL